MNLKKIGKLFTSKFVGTGPSSYKKRIHRAAVSQRLRNTALDYTTLLLMHTVAYRGGGVWCVQPPPKFRRYRWSPRSHEQEEPAS